MVLGVSVGSVLPIVTGPGMVLGVSVGSVLPIVTGAGMVLGVSAGSVLPIVTGAGVVLDAVCGAVDEIVVDCEELAVGADGAAPPEGEPVAGATSAGAALAEVPGV
jgi:hypothetical protein